MHIVGNCHTRPLFRHFGGHQQPPEHRQAEENEPDDGSGAREVPIDLGVGCHNRRSQPGSHKGRMVAESTNPAMAAVIPVSQFAFRSFCSSMGDVRPTTTFWYISPSKDVRSNPGWVQGCNHGWSY